jgi:Protein of unknown function (DUF4238)
MICGRMADNKNQHFVPKAHLKPFSVRGEGRAIHLFNLDRAQIFRDAPVKNQCAHDYFYGQDARLERAIQSVEEGYARCVSSLHEPRALIDDLHVTMLRRFAYLQHLRTEAAAKRSAEFTFALTDVRGADIERPTFKEAVRSGVIIAMGHYAETMDIVDDLKVRIVRNATSDPFITSDDPAALANRWHQQDERALHQSFGIVSAGTVLFLPLSPTMLAVLYDGDVYTAENSRGWIDVYNPKDIAACNYQQVLNCAANLYFGGVDATDYVRSMASAVAHLRPPKRLEVFTAVPDGGTDTHTRYRVTQDPDLLEHEGVLVHVRSISPAPPKWPSFLKFRSGRSVFTNDTGAGFRRRNTAVSNSWDSPPWRKIRG